MSQGHAPPPVALTMGEPAGIGGEIALKAWRTRGAETAAFFAVDDPKRLRAIAQDLRLAVPVVEIDDPAAAGAAFARGLPVLAVSLPRTVAPGTPSVENAPAVMASIERAVALALAGEASAVVTNPVHKETLISSGFRHPGHTEFLGELARRHTGQDLRPVMMLAADELRVVPVTVHLALRDVAANLSAEGIVAVARIAHSALVRDFGIARPRLAVSGLNPHAGEGGTLGREEQEVIAPAVAELRALGLSVQGPLAADAMFHKAARDSYDAAICMYHDQALIPFKTLAFEHGVNITLGLPFIRTSPDHGTAFDIAGTGRASETSLVAALSMAARMAARRGACDGHARVA